MNTVVPLDDLERETVAWCRQILTLSPIALRMLKAGFNAADDGLAGIQQLAGDATMLFYMSEEAQEGRNAYRRGPPTRLLEVSQASMSAPPGPLRRWVLAARPRTLPAAGVPVVVGVLLVRPATIDWFNSVYCLVIALALQIGTNYANDYSDGVRGTDEIRVGPFRLTASRLVAASRVRDAAWLGFAVAAAVGLVLASRTSWWLVPIGATRRARGVVLHRRAPAVRVLRLRRTLRLRLLRPRRDRRHAPTSSTSTCPRARGGSGSAAGFMACALLEANNLARRRRRPRRGQEDAWRRDSVESVRSGSTRCASAASPWRASARTSWRWHSWHSSCTFQRLRFAFSRAAVESCCRMLKYSARAQLQIGALLALLLATNSYWG